MESAVYHRHDPQQTVLWQVVQEHMESFFEYAESRSAEGIKSLPPYVKNAFRKFLKCGILAYGFARVRCAECGHNMLVAFSCKQRGICPSCEGRRMADTAAHLVDNVIPEKVPMRQWVLSLPYQLRWVLARNYRHVTEAVDIFQGEIRKCLTRKAKRRGLKGGQYGAVTAIQRFGGSLNLNPHLHAAVPDGVFVKDEETGEVNKFKWVSPPDEDDLERVLTKTAIRIGAYLKRKGVVIEASGGEESNEPEEDLTLTDVIQGASIRGWIGLSNEIRKVEVEGKIPRQRWVEPAEKPFTARLPGGACPAVANSIPGGGGWSVEAGVRIKGSDREGLEKVLRYILRPPFAGGRLERLPDGRIRYEYRRPRMDGSRAVILTPLELLEKLAALIPPQRAHLVRYHGILGPNAGARSGVVPPEKAANPEEAGCEHDHDHDEDTDPPRRHGGGRRKRLPWAVLLKRTFGIDVLQCPQCGGRMKVIACIEDLDVARKILTAMGLSAEPPRAAPARPPPQGRFEFDQS